MNDPRGSQWRRWDLHVHTPSSIYQNYGSNNDTTWEKFIKDLESLPSDFSVLGINDYLFLDGYERLIEEKSKNDRLKNIDLLLPVVEFRIEMFAGIDFGKLKRINLHVIFSDEVATDTIRSQFLQALEQSYTLESGKKWTRSITRESVQELGAEIKKSIPDEEKSKYGSDLSEGFNNLNIKDEALFKALDKDCFEGKYLIAIGKTEWDVLRWTDASITTKKSVINSADIVFTAAESVDAFNNAKTKLKEQKVNDLLLDCSDSHNYSNSTDKDRLGNCNTWIKADPTFSGLLQILIEPDDRIFVGVKPPSITRVEQNSTKYISEIRIQKIATSALDEIWFESLNPIPINNGLVAIIGNKGDGKSAISDIIGMAGNTHSGIESFSFLNDNKFRKKRPDRSEDFEASLIWEDQTIDGPKLLSNNPDKSFPEKVKYLPQSYLEKLCSETDESKFSDELKKVIFTHVNKSDRLGKHSLDDVIEYKSREINNSISQLQSEISEINQEIQILEDKNTPEYRKQIEEALKEKQRELSAHKENDPKKSPVPEPETDESVQLQYKQINEDLTNLRAIQVDLRSQIQDKSETKTNLTIKLNILEKFQKSLENFSKMFSKLREDYEKQLKGFEIEFDQAIDVKINSRLITDNITTTEKLISEIDSDLDENSKESLAFKLNNCNYEIQNLQSKLNEPAKKYEEYKDQIKIWEDKEKVIIGRKEDEGTIEFYKSIIDYLDNTLSHDLNQFKKKRIAKAKSVFSEKKKIVKLLEDLYEPVTRFIKQYGDFMLDYKMNLNVSMQLDDFDDSFFSFISRGSKGSFIGIDDGEKALKKITDGVNYNSEEETVSFITDVLDHLANDKRIDEMEPRRLRNQLKEGQEPLDFYNFLFNLEYLKPYFKLRLAEKELRDLSPGERGALLLIFYLLLDKQDIPLVIDQPEENLDNQSVYRILVKFIKEAKQRRQIIIVTHNPNLAVVCDAEQVIRVKIEKENKNKFVYNSGAIENPDVNDNILEILEGTFPAFNNRTRKYNIFPKS